jgi:mono/diheme cytochrome c family protein
VAIVNRKLRKTLRKRRLPLAAILFLLIFSFYGAQAHAGIEIVHQENQHSNLLWYQNETPNHPVRAEGIPPNDCSEKATDEAQFIQSLQNEKVKKMTDFLQEIPKGSLQNFTFVYDNADDKDAGVSKKYPRVLRWSNDGKIVMAYTCDPSAPSYGNVKVEVFDDATRSFKLMERRFSTTPSMNHLNKDQSSCVTCHGGSDPRTNWGSYENWKHTFGSFEDDLPRIKIDTNTGKPNPERTDFFAFRNAQMTNPCYSSLPWADYGKFPEYPYRKDFDRFGKEEGTNNLHAEYRPNDRFLTAQSRLLAQRLSRKLEESPGFASVKYLILMESAGCDISDEQKNFLKSALGSMYSGTAGYDHDLDPAITAPIMYAFGQKSGLLPTDWSLEFKAVIPGFSTGDQSIGVLAGGAMLESVAKTEKDLQPYVQLDKYNLYLWGPQYSCLDDLGGGIKLDQTKTNQFCKLLSDKQAVVMKSPDAACPLEDSGPAASLPQAASNFKSVDAARKYQTVQQNCASCHGNELTPEGFATGRFGKMTKSEFIKTVNARLTSQDPAIRMPYGKTAMTQDQIADILDYCRSL